MTTLMTSCAAYQSHSLIAATLFYGQQVTIILIWFFGLSNQCAKELLPTAELPQAFHHRKKIFAYLYT
jgi:hypothetical protein